MTVQTMLVLLGQGFLTTLSIFFLTLIGSLPLGLLVYFGKQSRIAPVRWAVNAYISIMRGTPLMLQLMVVYFGPNLLFGLTLPSNWRFTAVIIGFVINYAAYFAEIYRGGIESMPVGQYEAASVLGYSKFQTFMRIILPQVVKRILPPIGNEVITLEGYFSGPHHFLQGNHYDGQRVYLQGSDLAAVLHRCVLPGLCRRTDAALRLAGEEDGLF